MEIKDPATHKLRRDRWVATTARRELMVESYEN